jgi:hypothetical protein
MASVAMKVNAPPSLVRLAAPSVLTLFGLLFVGVGFGRMVLDHYYAADGTTALATVTSHTNFQTTWRASSSRTEYEFRTPDGIPVKGNQAGYTAYVGERVKIEYLPRSPGWNRFAGAETRTAPWNIPMAAAGLLATSAGLYALRRTIRDRSGLGFAPDLS